MLPAIHPTTMSTTHPSMRHKLRRSLCLLLVVVAGLGVACGGGDDRPSAEERAVGATGKLTDHDVDVLAGLGEHSGKWNEIAGPFVRDYLDSSVDAETWLASADQQFRDLRGVVVRLDAEVLSISDAGVRGVLGEIVTNYKRKLAAVNDLVSAVRDGDDDAQRAAADELTVAGQEGQQIATRLLDKLREFIDPDELDRMLRERGEKLADMFGGG